jgi:alpha-N-arabinofuranosidase
MNLKTSTVITVTVSKPLPFKIPSTIFGTFLELIGNSTYGGLWADALANPSFEENLWSARRIAEMIEEEPALARAALGIPLPWEPMDYAQGARYAPRWNDAANSFRSLLIMALPGKETGIRQKVYLPVHRVLRYNASVYARHLSGPGSLEISIRERNKPDIVLASQTVGLTADGWQKYQVALDIPKSFQDAALRSSQEVIIGNTDYNPKRMAGCIRRMVERKVDGVAIMTSEADPGLITELTRRHSDCVHGYR